MNQEIFDWILLLARWLHITVAVTWIGTSIFFMWLDRSFEVNPESKRPGHVGEVWMVHGGGFYHVEKLLMGPTKVPERLHWFKWESYWTWMSGMILVILIYYTGEGTYLLDSMISNITYWQGLLIGLFSIFGSWFFYDFVWESKLSKVNPVAGHILTLAWFAGMSYFLCHTLSGRAAYIHIGGMLGTWMTANVFMRIIPRQLKMVEASRVGEPVNQEWGKNAKNRSTHNTYFTLPVIFIMLSNHFPATYGHDYSWLILLVISAGGAAIREYFVVRLKNPKRSMASGAIGIALITAVIVFSPMTMKNPGIETAHTHEKKVDLVEAKPIVTGPSDLNANAVEIKGVVNFEGDVPKGKKLNLPSACAVQFKGDVYSNEVIVNNGKLQNALIRITAGHEKLPAAEVPAKEVELDQRGCIYTPRVVGVRAGQKVTFINSDPLFHNVRSVTTENTKFNMAMPHKNQRETKIFNSPEIFLQAKCSVHPWMGAYVAVMDHPFFAVTNEKGEFKINNLPPGEYEIEAWHEKFGTQKRIIKVLASGQSDLNFSFGKGNL
ncbi:MAG TPA: urate hydroxylase PuuD [Bacteriovoracaceae bacterium]|nr:urate hydroxylase PuuD [Bacteriovoracaceae bacterium]